MKAGICHTKVFILLFLLLIIIIIIIIIHYLSKNVSVSNGPTGVGPNSWKETNETTGLLLWSLTYTFCHLQSATELLAVRNDACAFPERAVCASRDSQTE